jgi:hypothetical protein
MITTKHVLGLVALLGLSACASVDTASRNETGITSAPAAIAAPAGATEAAPRLAQIALTGYEVEVPGYLKVSEANAYIPRADIVWRGDAPGDRYRQVEAIFEAGLAQAAPTLQGGVPAHAKITVRRFHGLTEKARYTTGGVHNIIFDLALYDPATGALLRPVETVHADMRALGGNRAIEADAAGQTQKVRVTEHLRRTLLEELTQPGGHENARLGVIQALNYAR